MQLFRFVIIKLTICLVVGILLAYYFKIPLLVSIAMSVVFLLSLVICVYLSRNKFSKNIVFGILTFLTTISIGILVVNVHNRKLHQNHYTNSEIFKTDSLPIITFRVREILKSDLYNNKYIVDLLQINSVSVSGKTVLLIKKDSLQNNLEIDDVFCVSETFSEIKEASNPGQFHYKQYLAKQYIYHQIYTRNEHLFRVSDNKHTFWGYASSLRKTINNRLDNFDFKPDELAIINALILGQRQDISKTVYTNYVNAGAIHILAVSGLHVGILLLFLNLLLKPLRYLKKGNLIQVIVILIMLWCYVVIAGASASIIRAATMFSVVAIAMHLKRKSNIYNTLAVSIFIILLLKPMFLFDVGFQLSYLAVIAIVTIQPLLYKLWKPKLWVINKLWQVFTVTLAAQFGVLPISLYYFHQLPGLFWLSNLVIIPLIGVLLICGILIIILALVNILPKFIANAYGNGIGLMNDFFAWIASKEAFLVENISFNIYFVLASYLLIIALVSFYMKQNYKRLQFLGIAIIGLQLAAIYTKTYANNETFIVFHKSRKTMIGKHFGNKLQIFHNLDTISENNMIANFAVKNYINAITYDSLQSIYFYKSSHIFVVDSLGVYTIKSIAPDYVLLRNSPKINLNRLIDSLNPKLIVADGSNYKSYIARWERSCAKRKIPFHQTGKKGAFIIK